MRSFLAGADSLPFLIIFCEQGAEDDGSGRGWKGGEGKATTTI